MKILFVSSGNKGFMNPLIKEQRKSLLFECQEKLVIDSYLIKGSGVPGYLSNIKKLKTHLRNNNYDLIHAHFSFSGVISFLAGGDKIITSLMGSDVNKNLAYKLLAIVFTAIGWDHTIVKSQKMVANLVRSKVSVIPNGVDLSKFEPFDRDKACQELNWDSSYKHILFAANPDRKEKNIQLTKNAVDFLSNKYNNLQIHVLKDIPHSRIPYMMNASDVVILSSKWEGSPNVIKEAMACNRPIVCTDVGDVSWLFGDEPGHFITMSNPSEVANNLDKALEFSKKYEKTDGRNRIKRLGLDSEKISERILDVYKKVIA